MSTGNTNRAKYTHLALVALITWLVIIAVTMIFMVAVAAIPMDSAVGQKIWTHAEASVYTWADEDESPLFHNTQWYNNDHGDDMLIADTAITDGYGSALQTAVALPRHKVESEDDSATDMNSMIAAVYYGDDNSNVVTYERFYMLAVPVLKVLFIFLDIVGVRYLMYFVTTALAMTIVCLLYGRFGWRGVVPFVTACAFRLIFEQSVTIATFSDITLGLVGMLVVLLFSERQWFRNYEPVFFMVVGMYAFIDCMMYAPLFTLGMPLVTTILIYQMDDGKVTSWVRLLVDSLAWLFGYGTAMLSKQLISIAVLGGQTASDEAKYMLGLDMTLSERLEMIVHNLQGLMDPLDVKLPVLLIIVAIMVIAIIRGGYVHYRYWGQLLVLALYPIVWICIVCRHSLHYFVANNMTITMFALLSALALMSYRKKS